MTAQNPQFLYANDFQDTAHLTVSSNNSTAFKARLFDKRPKFQHVTTGQTGSNATYVYAPGDSPSISSLIILNCNWAAFTATYNSGTAFSTAISVSGATGGDFYFEFNAVTITDITITVTATSPAGAEKRVGQIIFSRNLYTFPENASAITINPSPQQVILTLSSGRKVIYNIDTSLYQYEASLTLVAESELDNITDLLDEADINAVFFITRPDTTAGSWDGVCDHVIIENGREIRNFSGPFFGAGYDVRFVMSPAGGTP